MRVRGFDLGQCRVECAQIERLLVNSRGDTQSSADVERTHAADALGNARELDVYIFPMGKLQNSRAQMRMQSGDAYVVRRGEALELGQFVERQTKLRLRPAGLDLVVMAAADAQIQA